MKCDVHNEPEDGDHVPEPSHQAVEHGTCRQIAKSIVIRRLLQLHDSCAVRSCRREHGQSAHKRTCRTAAGPARAVTQMTDTSRSSFHSGDHHGSLERRWMQFTQVTR
jgi:hypothetical protein